MSYVQGFTVGGSPGNVFIAVGFYQSGTPDQYNFSSQEMGTPESTWAICTPNVFS